MPDKWEGLRQRVEGDIRYWMRSSITSLEIPQAEYVSISTLIVEEFRKFLKREFSQWLEHFLGRNCHLK
ncbi:MAG: hypothetical protein DRG36_05330 [Deltaproteobacteria bacterium]|nr:MAG: hypothetical protein DRG36_05330 [Deltaproteobacteria bacterium]